MKKFVGSVNGKSFDNEKEFNEAANEAIKSNDGNLAISSYYSYTNDDDDRKELEDKRDDNYVLEDEYFLGEAKPEVTGENTFVYNIPDTLVKRLKNATNKEDIVERLNDHLLKLGNTISFKNNRIKELQKEIENLQDDLYNYEDSLKELNARKKYYDTVFSIVHNDEKEEKPVKPITKNDINKLIGIDSDMSLYTFLQKVGLLK